MYSKLLVYTPGRGNNILTSRSTDDFASSLSLVDNAPVRVGQTETGLDVDFEMVLQEYAHVCTDPNDAELEMLSVALGVEKAVITRWCEFRRSGNRNVG